MARRSSAIWRTASCTLRLLSVGSDERISQRLVISTGDTCTFKGKQYKLEEEWDDEEDDYRYQCQASEGKVVVMVVGETPKYEHLTNLCSLSASLPGELDRCKDVLCAHQPRC